MAVFSDSIDAILDAYGYQPDEPAIPDAVQLGHYGWTYEQSQAATASLAAGKMIDFTSAIGDGDTPGTPGRVGAILDLLSPNQDPKVMALARHAWVDVSADVALTSSFLADLANKLYIAWKPSGVQERRYAIGPAIQTNFSSKVQFDHDGDATQVVSRAAVPVPLPGLIADLEHDAFVLGLTSAVALPTSAIVRLTVWFDGALIAKDGDVARLVTKGCAAGGQMPALRRAAALARIPRFAPMIQG